ncbi:hypothetical protein DLM78_06990 [Leptospira stimsonii]|uniref:Uncharacterized protein n=1 Tax=Leptospira stimsonii TaxID=2202203 RepID=A0A8B3CY55_9LEPT|nr:hypothetical protein DLM78_06990 [Leptospira stimsonii]
METVFRIAVLLFGYLVFNPSRNLEEETLRRFNSFLRICSLSELRRFSFQDYEFSSWRGEIRNINSSIAVHSIQNGKVYRESSLSERLCISCQNAVILSKFFKLVELVKIFAAKRRF